MKTLKTIGFILSAPAAVIAVCGPWLIMMYLASQPSEAEKHFQEVNRISCQAQ